MMVNLFNGGDEGCGVLTSGGTESIIMSCKAARDYMRDKKGIVEPEMVVADTIHAAFDKASQYFGIKLVRVPVDPVTFKVRPADMERAITSNTVLLGASTPCFSQGKPVVRPSLLVVICQAFFVGLIARRLARCVAVLSRQARLIPLRKSAS